MQEMRALEKVLRAYEAYYNVERENVKPPFAAEAVFQSHDEQFFLVRSVKLGEAESNEYIFFAETEHLTEEELRAFDEAAWTEGLSRVKPHSDHRNTDITLVVLGNTVEDEAFAAASKLQHYKSYRLGFQGWSQYRLVVLEEASGRMAFNRQGQSLKKLFNNIFK